MKNKGLGVWFGIFILLICASLIGFISMGEEYYDYATTAVEMANAPSLPDKQAARQAVQMPMPPDPVNTEIKFRNFFLTFPGAKKVELQADFNRWGKTPLVLSPYSRGYFEISVALAAGEYKYVFLVDGKDVLDPSNTDRTQYNGREVCIKTVR